MDIDNNLADRLKKERKTWLVTGVAGFIGSRLMEILISNNQHVIGLDNFSMAGSEKLNHIQRNNDRQVWNNFELIKGDIRDIQTCIEAVKNVDYVLHHAAIGSVPLSFEDRTYVDAVNIDGTRNMLQAASETRIKRFIFASSSAVYGDYTEQPNKEDQELRPLSPYAEGKLKCEELAEQFQDLETIGFRYFNIYGPRQDPKGSYAAVIPRWIMQMLKEEDIEIYGDGQAVRDFCFVDDVCHANISAAIIDNSSAVNSVYNVASGSSIKLLELFELLKSITGYSSNPIFKDTRQGDIVISCADTSRLKEFLEINAKIQLQKGLEQSVNYYKSIIE